MWSSFVSVIMFIMIIDHQAFSLKVMCTSTSDTKPNSWKKGQRMMIYVWVLTWNTIYIYNGTEWMRNENKIRKKNWIFRCYLTRARQNKTKQTKEEKKESMN